MSQINTFVTDSALPAGLASICHHRGIQVVEAMDKPAADDEPEAAQAAEAGEGANAPIPIRRA
jgi:DeoR family glycerol-3-phosphate regulon repressor